MKNTARFILAIALAGGLMSTGPLTIAAQAAGASGDYQRAKQCGQMRRAGTVQWYSIATGTVNDGSGRDGYSGFVTRACHATRASCERWVSRIGHEIDNLDTVETAYCKRAG